MKVSKFINLLVAISLLTSSVASFGGNGGVHGGDPKVVRKALMFGELIESSLKKEVLAYLDWITQNPDQIGPVEMRNDLLKLIKWGLAADVQATPAYKALYDQACSAVDPKTKLTIAVPAATQEEASSEICFSVPLLMENRFSWEEIVALTVHEHAHHLKYSDENHSLMTAIAESMKVFSGTRQNAIQNLLNSGLRSAIIESENPNDPFLILTFSADQRFVNILVCNKQSQLCQLEGGEIWLNVQRYITEPGVKNMNKFALVMGNAYGAIFTFAGIATLATGGLAAGPIIVVALGGGIIWAVTHGYYKDDQINKAVESVQSTFTQPVVRLSSKQFNLLLRHIGGYTNQSYGETRRNLTVVLRPSLP